MSKKIIICGASRSGKTTLSRMLAQKYQCALVPCDPLVTTFQHLYPELGITHEVHENRDEYSAVCVAFTKFLTAYIQQLDFEMDSYIIEGFHIDIAALHKTLRDTHTIVVLGYPDVSLSDKLQATRTADSVSDDRTTDIVDSELVKLITFFIDLSKRQQQIAIANDIRYINTSHNHDDVLQQACSQL